MVHKRGYDGVVTGKHAGAPTCPDKPKEVTMNMKTYRMPTALTVAVLAAAICMGCDSPAHKGEPSTTGAAEKAVSPSPPPAPDGGVTAAADANWPQIRGGHYIKWVGRVWNTRKPSKVRQAGQVGTLGQRNGTGTYLGEDKVNAGAVEFDVKFDAGYLAPKGGGKHFLEIMSWMGDRSDREAIRAKPSSRIELANLGDRPRCIVWNYGPQFRGRATTIFKIGPALRPDRWYRIRFDWSYRAPAGTVTIHVDGRRYADAFKFVPGTVGPGRYFLFGHVETTQPEGCLHFRNFRVLRG